MPFVERHQRRQIRPCEVIGVRDQERESIVATNARLARTVPALPSSTGSWKSVVRYGEGAEATYASTWSARW